MININTIAIRRFVAMFLRSFVILIFCCGSELSGQEVVTYPKMNKSSNVSNEIELVDVFFSDNNTIDVKIRNLSKSVIFFKRVKFVVKNVWYIWPFDGICLHIPSSATYDVELPSKNVPYQKEIYISQAIKPNDVDRFSFKLDVDGDYIYLFTMRFACNKDNWSLYSGNILLFIKNKTSFYNYASPLNQYKKIDSRYACNIYNNKKALDALRNIKVRCSSGVNNIKRYIQSYLPHLELWYHESRKKLKRLAANNCISQIDELINPIYGLHIDDSEITFGNITDEATRNIACLPKLTALDLSQNEITDKGLVCLPYLQAVYR